MKNNTIHITNYDKKRLLEILQKALLQPKEDTELLKQLQRRLNNASVISQKGTPPYLVTMNCHVGVTDLDENKDMDFWLAYPDEASSENDKLSVISDIGIAVLGLKVGDEVEYADESKIKRLRIARIYYQPEENQHYKL
ncbi:MAG: GreA/GreB family elongation factor [Sedimentisphaerales bacterium]|nr:GreA/GreB family elongation factor [Sedimentisphaerales bacterium]